MQVMTKQLSLMMLYRTSETDTTQVMGFLPHQRMVSTFSGINVLNDFSLSADFSFFHGKNMVYMVSIRSVNSE